MHKAFTILEIIITMAIVASLMGLGIATLISYRASVQLQSAYTDTVGAIQTLQNKAINSSSVKLSNGTIITPDIFVLNFANNSVIPYYCTISGSSFVHCDTLSGTGIVSYQQTYSVNATATCSGAGFTRLSGDVASVNATAFTGNGAESNTGSCILTLTNTNSGDSRQITFDLTSNKVNI